MNLPSMPEKKHLAFAYVPIQEFRNLYSTEKALENGTIFEELNMPFELYKDNPIMNPFIK